MARASRWSCTNCAAERCRVPPSRDGSTTSATLPTTGAVSAIVLHALAAAPAHQLYAERQQLVALVQHRGAVHRREPRDGVHRAAQAPSRHAGRDCSVLVRRAAGRQVGERGHAVGDGLRGGGLPRVRLPAGTSMSDPPRPCARMDIASWISTLVGPAAGTGASNPSSEVSRAGQSGRLAAFSSTTCTWSPCSTAMVPNLSNSSPRRYLSTTSPGSITSSTNVARGRSAPSPTRAARRRAATRPGGCPGAPPRAPAWPGRAALSGSERAKTMACAVASGGTIGERDLAARAPPRAAGWPRTPRRSAPRWSSTSGCGAKLPAAALPRRVQVRRQVLRDRGGDDARRRIPGLHSFRLLRRCAKAAVRAAARWMMISSRPRGKQQAPAP